MAIVENRTELASVSAAADALEARVKVDGRPALVNCSKAIGGTGVSVRPREPFDLIAIVRLATRRTHTATRTRRRRHGQNIPGHHEVQADEPGENGRAVRPREKQSGGECR